MGETALYISTIRMMARGAKQKELTQTLLSLAGRTRDTEGCTGCHVSKDLENEAVVSLTAQWDTRKAFEDFAGSDVFKILVGAIESLASSPRVTLSAVSSATEWTDPSELSGVHEPA